jgi:hypothetical protein
MSLNGKAYIVGAYEHPTRKADDLSVVRLHADVAKGALEDAGLTKDDIDAYFCAGDAPGLGTTTMAEYLGLKLRHVDSTECGGSAPILHVAHAAAAIAAGRCNVALITLAGRPRAAGAALSLKAPDPDAPELAFELPFGPATQNLYGMVARRHMHEFGTTSEQLAWIKVAASHHAQHNPNAMLRNVVTVEEVVNSPMVSDPLHRLDCCVMSDGGGAIIVARPEIARDIAARQKRPMVKVRGTGEAPKHSMGGRIDLTYSAAAWSGPAAFAEAGPHACRHPIRVALRQLHDHRADAARGPRLLQEGRGRALRAGRRADLRYRPAAVQHRRRRPVQQPSGQPRRRDQDHRSRAPVARRGASRRAGEELRPRARQRHRRCARVAPHGRYLDHGKGVMR